ncbi:DUF6524 family protein, partial [Nitratifractor sp.]|uniref:DUF6524 family protein n=1 Tax=Nitratifractor sp. TaxID=2268144 RepID=UPI0025D7BC6A
KGSTMLPDILIKKSTTKNGKTVRHLRWWVSMIMAMALAAGTWNPTGHHFIHYISQGNPLEGFRPFFILVMIALWIMAFKAIYQSIKWYGAAIAAAIIAAFVYGLATKGWLDTSDWTVLGWVITIGMGLIIWLGLNASIIWKTATGVYTTESNDVED